MGTLSRAAAAKEKISLPVIHHHGRMHFQRTAAGGGECEHQHQGIVQGKLSVFLTEKMENCLGEVFFNPHLRRLRPLWKGLHTDLPAAIRVKNADFRKSRTVIGTKHQLRAIFRDRIRDFQVEYMFPGYAVFLERSEIRHRVEKVLLRAPYSKNESCYAIESFLTHIG